VLCCVVFDLTTLPHCKTQRDGSYQNKGITVDFLTFIAPVICCSSSFDATQVQDGVEETVARHTEGVTGLQWCDR
jgi:hypothetical protein